MALQTVGIVGLGLMGGSLSLALQRSGMPYRFIGLDHNHLHCSQAMALGLVEKIADSLDEIGRCDIIFLTIPVDGIIAVTQSLHPEKPHCTVIDLGSTKAKISESIPQETRHFFVTAHPMTGTEKFGPSAALPDLYKGKVVVLCDLEKSGKPQRETAQKIFRQLGMKLAFMGAREHDRHAAFISHMPHALSYALRRRFQRYEPYCQILSQNVGRYFPAEPDKPHRSHRGVRKGTQSMQAYGRKWRVGETQPLDAGGQYPARYTVANLYISITNF